MAISGKGDTYHISTGNLRICNESETDNSGTGTKQHYSFH